MSRRLVLMVLAVGLLAGAAGAALTLAVAPRATEAQQDVYRARRFEVHDHEGRTLAALESSDGIYGTGAGLVFYDIQGRVHLSMGQLEVEGDEGIIFSIRDDRGRLRLGLGLSNSGATAGIAIFDEEGNLIWSAP